MYQCNCILFKSFIFLNLNTNDYAYYKISSGSAGYQKSFDTAMEIYQLSKIFPTEERYSLTDQIRRSSRSVSANISKAWGKRKYEKSFILKLTDSEGEARELRFGCNLQEVVSILMKNNLKF